MWPFKKKTLDARYTRSEVSVCEKPDCRHFFTFIIIEPGNLVMWNKNQNNFNGMSGPLPCMLCKEFKRIDLYER